MTAVHFTPAARVRRPAAIEDLDTLVPSEHATSRCDSEAGPLVEKADAPASRSSSRVRSTLLRPGLLSWVRRVRRLRLAEQIKAVQQHERREHAKLDEADLVSLRKLNPVAFECEPLIALQVASAALLRMATTFRS